MNGAELARTIVEAIVVIALVPVLVARGDRRALSPAEPDDTTISVVVPARNEEARIGECLRALVDAPGVVEVIVVDDGSTDATASVAREHGARVVDAGSLPEGWAGKVWALTRGVEAARGEWIVTLDADTRAEGGLFAAAVARARTDRLDLLSVAGRIECPTRGVAWLHPAMLTTLVYRYGPPPGSRRRRASRVLANGQCMVLRRDRVDVLSHVRGETIEDVALARRIVGDGGRVGMVEGGGLLTVRMYESFADAWRGWGRSIGLASVDPAGRRLVHAAVTFVAQAALVPALVVLGPSPGLIALVALRLGTLVGTRRAYLRGGLAYWASPLADPIAWVAMASGSARRMFRRGETWRGRVYR